MSKWCVFTRFYPEQVGGGQYVWTVAVPAKMSAQPGQFIKVSRKDKDPIFVKLLALKFSPRRTWTPNNTDRDLWDFIPEDKMSEKDLEALAAFKQQEPL